MTFDEVVKKYNQCDNIRQTADEFGISFSKTKKILISMGAYSTDLSDDIALLKSKGFSNEEIMNMLKISKNVFNINTPYDKGEYNSDNPSEMKMQYKLESREKKGINHATNRCSSSILKRKTADAKTDPL